MIGWEYPPHNSGGLGVACEGLTEALAEQNTQIYFTLPYQHPQPIGHMHVLGVVDPKWKVPSAMPPFSVYQGLAAPVDVKRFTAAELRTLPTSQLEQKVGEYSNVIVKTAKNLSEDFEVVHAHDWMTYPAAQRVAEQTGKPLIAHIHSTEFDRIPNGNGSHFIHHTEYQGLQAAARVIAVSYYTKQLLVDKYSIDPTKIDVVHNGAPRLDRPIDPGRHHFASKRPVIVFMGRLTMQKGAEYFLKIAETVLKKQPQALFIVAGNGDQYQQLLFSTAYHGLTAHVLFSGFLRGTEREKLLDRADIFVMPSLSEPFGLVAVEAAQHHTPVIVSKTTGVSEVLPSAIAVDFWDTDVMADTILELLANDRQRNNMIASQLQEVAANSWQKAATSVREIYRKAFLG